MSSTHWFVRVDEGSATRQTQMMELLTQYHSTLCVRENPDKDSKNPHYHFTLKLEKAIGREALNARIKKVITDLSGNKDFSSRVWNHDDTSQTTDMYNYMCKGEGEGYVPITNPAVTRNTNIDIKKHHNLYWYNNKNVKKGKDNPFSTDSIIAKTIAEIKLYPDIYCLTSKTCIAEERVVFQHVVAQMLKASSGKLQPNQAYSITSAVMYHFYPTWVFKNLHQNLAERFFLGH